MGTFLRLESAPRVPPPGENEAPARPAEPAKRLDNQAGLTCTEADRPAVLGAIHHTIPQRPSRSSTKMSGRKNDRPLVSRLTSIGMPVDSCAAACRPRRKANASIPSRRAVAVVGSRAEESFSLGRAGPESMFRAEWRIRPPSASCSARCFLQAKAEKILKNFGAISSRQFRVERLDHQVAIPPQASTSAPGL